MPAARKPKPAANNNKIEVILDTQVLKKGTVRFETETRPVDLTNIYLGRAGFQKLGSPAAVKVTIESYEQEA